MKGAGVPWTDSPTRPISSALARPAPASSLSQAGFSEPEIRRACSPDAPCERLFQVIPIKKLIGVLVETWCFDRGIELAGFGSWTLKEKKDERGAEADDCYIFGTEPRDRPDLAIEVEWTRGGIDKLDVYRKLGVGEGWIWRKGVIEVYVLAGDVFERAEHSAVLPDLDLPLLTSMLDRDTLTQAVRDFRRALRA